ncbi:hypothetical protein ACJ5H2_01215 [Nocardioides sp. R1-1]|uniref:hypothetical protein n=1 Tax=Nocardioides sp. R1-1 TaxID=3383502 RepID=UPI0038D088AF
MRMKLAIATAGVLTLLLSAGCSGADEPRSARASTSGSGESAGESSAKGSTGSAAPVDASVVRGRAEYDFPHTTSITAASRKAATVVVGEVVGWSDGRSMVESDGAGYEAISRTAVLTVKVKKAQGSPGRGPATWSTSRCRAAERCSSTASLRPTRRRS